MNKFANINTLEELEKIKIDALCYNDTVDLEVRKAQIITNGWTLDDLKHHMEEYNSNKDLIEDTDEFSMATMCCCAANNLINFEAIFPKKEITYVYVINIHKAVIDEELAKHCVYLEGNYIGQVFVDSHLRMFNTINEAMAANGNDIVVIPNSSYKYYEFKYIEELDMVAAFCQPVSYRHDYYFSYALKHDANQQLPKNYKGQWKLGDVEYFLIDKNLTTVCVTNNENNLNRFGFEWNLLKGSNKKPIGFMESFKKLLRLPSGIVNIGGNSYVALDNIEDLRKFKSYTAEFEHKNGKVQNKIDELVAMKDFSNEEPPARLPHQYENMTCNTVISRINQNLSVIRWVYNYKDELFDGMRIYVDGDDVYACKQNSRGQFVRISLSNLNQKNFASYCTNDIKMDDMDGTRLQYYASIINDIPDDLKIMTLTLFLIDPKIEQLIKLGYQNTIYHYLRNDKRNVSNAIKKGVLANASGKNINQWLGVNKYQIAAFKKYCTVKGCSWSLFALIGEMKKLFFGMNDISCINNNEFDEAFKVFTEKNGYYERCYSQRAHTWHNKITADEVFKVIEDFGADDNAGVLKNNIRKYLPKFFHMCEWKYKEWNWYSDTLFMIHKMNIHKKVKLYPRTIEELKNTHDMVAEAYNLYNDEIKKTEFVEQIKKIENLQYDTPEYDFCVKIPTKAEDLVVEGVELCHCVKSYIDKVAYGYTNIVFVRKKESPEKPFFTVEVTNDKVIKQVHGFGNRNADTEPELLDFLKKWASNKKIKIGNINRVI